MNITIYTDGGSIHNPGPSAIGVVLLYEDKIKTYAEKIEDGTNNEAEYKAVIFALKKIKLLLGKKIKNAHISLYLDSQLIGSQLQGMYKIQEKSLQELFMQYWNLHLDFPPIVFKIIPREQNTQADKLVKSVLFPKKLV